MSTRSSALGKTNVQFSSWLACNDIKRRLKDQQIKESNSRCDSWSNRSRAYLAQCGAWWETHQSHICFGWIKAAYITKECTWASSPPTRFPDSNSFVFPAPWGCPIGRGAQTRSFTPFPTNSQKDIRMTSRVPNCILPAYRQIRTVV